MANNSSNKQSFQQELADFRAMQEEMLNLSQEYGQGRQAAWADEIAGLEDGWDGFSQDWQGSLAEMTALATSQFGEISAQGESAASQVSQGWDRALTDLTGQVDDWGEHCLQTLAQVASAWMQGVGGGSGSGSGGGWLGLLGGALDFGGLFHQGGVVTAHEGMVVSPGTRLGDEQLILAQTGEGILPRDSMSRLGEGNFEALRRGNFDLTPGGAAPRYDFTIQVQSLDAAGVAGLDWGRVVQRQLLPLLQKEMDRRF
jgi:hypothetical protein